MSQGGRDSTFNDLLPSSVGKHGEGAGRASNGADGPRDAPRSGGQHDRQDSQGRGFPMPQGRPQALPADNFTDYPKRGEPMAMRPQSARSESTEGDGHERGAQGHDSGDQKGMAQVGAGSTRGPLDTRVAAPLPARIRPRWLVALSSFAMPHWICRG